MILWGVQPLGFKWVVAFATAETIVCFRFLFAFATLGAWLTARGALNLSAITRLPRLVLVSPVCLGASFALLIRGIDLAGPTTGALFMQTSLPLFALVGVLFFKERMRGTQWGGLALVFAGITLFGWGRLEQESQGGATATGVVFCLLSAVSWTLWATLNKVLLDRGQNPHTLNLVTYVLASLLVIPFVHPMELATAGAIDWLVLVMLGSSTLLAYGCLTQAIRAAPASTVSTIICLNPIVAVSLTAALQTAGLTWVGPESVTAVVVVGAALQVSGSLVALARHSSTQPGH